MDYVSKIKEFSVTLNVNKKNESLRKLEDFLEELFLGCEEDLTLDIILELLDIDVINNLLQRYNSNLRMINRIAKVLSDFSLDDQKSINYYINSLSDYPPLSHEETTWLFKQIELGSSSAREKVINCNLRLVIFLARKFRVGNAYNLSLEDFIAIGNEGLIKAVDNFDYKLGYKFSTFASSVIEGYIKRYISENVFKYKVSSNSYYTYSRYLSLKRETNPLTGQNYTDEEIANIMNVTIKELNEFISYFPNVVSIDKPLSDESDSLVEDLIADTRQEPIEQILINKLLKEDILYYINFSPRVSDSERSILLMRYFNENNEVMTLSELSDMFGVTGERIRQIDASAISKLRSAFNCAISIKELVKSEEKFYGKNTSSINVYHKFDNTKFITIDDVLSKYPLFNSIILRHMTDEERKRMISLFGENLNKKIFKGNISKSVSLELKYFKGKYEGFIHNYYELEKRINADHVLSCDLRFFKENYGDFGTDSSTYSKSTLDLSILLLTLGFVKDKYFSFSAIAEALEISESYVKETVMQFMLSSDPVIKELIERRLYNVISDKKDKHY